ncbi:hypothetical protein M758_6G005900 [Ceratodon purpureus]|nr:hypothetical protein M758_6G005900 [Ceratodon purpureus]
MGAQLDIVVDISRGDRGGAQGAIATSKMMLGGDVVVAGDAVEHSPRVSSSGTADSSDGKPDAGDVVNHEKEEHAAVEGHGHGEKRSPVHASNGNASKIVAGSSKSSKVQDVDTPDKEAAAYYASVVDGLANFVPSNGSPHDGERLMKNGGSRKRKKTVYYMNSRVPHSAPLMENEEGSDDQDSPEEVEDTTLVRPSQAPRVAASKLKSMVPVGDKLVKPPRNAKELMATKLLEGHFVRCSCRGAQLTGMLKDMGVQCDCRNCQGLTIVSISAFEAHSGSTSHHPSDNIYLENGKNLRDILSAGQEAADCGDNILRALKMAIGEIQSFEKKKIACANCGGSEGNDLISCKGARCSLIYHAGCVGNVNPQLADWFCPKCEKTKKPHAVTKAKRPIDGGTEEDAKMSEKESARAARDAHFHEVLFQAGGLEDGTELGYYSNTECKLKGVKQGRGIRCFCCNQEISCAMFEQHAGCEARRNPYGSILLVADRRSLKDVCKELAVKEKLDERAKHVPPTAEVVCCIECGESGEIKCCPGCDRTWCGDCAKTSQQGGPKDSDGKWSCRFCQENTFKVVQNGQKVSGNHTSGLPEIIEIDDRGRSIRHLLAPVSVGGCAICKKWNSSNSGYAEGMTMLVCDQCGRDYHVGCLRNSGMDNLHELPEGEWFCQKDCKDIDEILTQLVANGPESLSDSIISELLESRQQQNGVKEKSQTTRFSFGWQILCGKSGSAVNTQTLSEAVAIFTDCLDPIRDSKTGKNLIPLMVHSKRTKEYDFEGLFCVSLKLNGKVVSAALLQIFGREIAEVPLVATSLPHQGQGFCKALMTTIERLLGVLSVDRLVLPTAKNAESIWINKFGFRRMEDQQLAKICTTIRLLTFSGTCMLEKPITPMTV